MSSHGSLNFIQINLHHARLASDVFSRKFDLENGSIGLIQEPYCTRNRVRNICCGNLLYKMDGTRAPRAALIFRKGLPFMALNQFVTEDLVAASLDLNISGVEHKMVIVSSYHHYENAVVSDVLQRLIEFCRKGGRQLIFGCDANAHNQNWGGEKTDKRGEEMQDFVVENDLTILNTGFKPTYCTARSKSFIDLTIVTNFIADEINDWRVDDDLSHSDHNYIKFSIKARGQEQETYRDPKKTNWTAYKVCLEQLIPSIVCDIQDKHDIDSVVNQLNSCLISAYHSSNLEVKKTSNTKNKWWNANLAKKRKNLRRLYNKAKLNGDWESYKVALYDFTSAVRQAKSDSWAKTMEELEDLSATSRFHKILTKRPSHKNRFVEKRNFPHQHGTRELGSFGRNSFSGFTCDSR